MSVANMEIKEIKYYELQIVGEPSRFFRFYEVAYASFAGLSVEQRGKAAILQPRTGSAVIDRDGECYLIGAKVE